MKVFKKIAAIVLGITTLAGIAACTIATPDTKNMKAVDSIAAIEDSYTEPVSENISENISDINIIPEISEDITSEDITDISDNTNTNTDTNADTDTNTNTNINYTSETDDVYTDSDDTDTPESDYTEKYTHTQPEIFTVSNTKATTTPKETVISETVSPKPDLIKSEDTVTEDYKVKSDITYETSDKNTSTVTVTSEGDDLIPIIPEEAIDIAAILPAVVVTETIDYLEVLEEDASEPAPDCIVTEEEITEETIIDDNTSDNTSDNTVDEAVEDITKEDNVKEAIVEETVEDATENDDNIEETSEEEVIIEDVTVEDEVTEETVTEDAVIEDNTVEETTIEDTIIEDDTTTEEPVVDEIIKDTTIEEKTTNDTVVEDTITDNTVVEDTQPEEPETQEEAVNTILYTPSYELSPEATELYSWIVENTLNPAGKVSYTKQVSNQTYTEATDAVEADYFKYSAGPFTSWSSYSGTTIDSDLSYEYMLKDEFIRTNIQNIENQIFYEGISQEDAIAAINNWFKTNYSYKYGIYDMYTALENNGGVCMTYAMIAQALCNDIGIDCYYITGEADNGVEKGGHAWNKVNINGKWYYIDFTWNTSSKYYLSESLWEDHWETGCQKLFV